jgi:hypothetical protein
MNNNRALSVIEQAMELLNRQHSSFNIVTISRIKGEIREEILRSALDAVQSIHPLLSSRIVGTLDHLEFTNQGTGKIPLCVVSQGINDNWEDVVREELNTTSSLQAIRNQHQLFNHNCTSCHIRRIILYKSTIRNLEMLPNNCLWQFH